MAAAAATANRMFTSVRIVLGDQTDWSVARPKQRPFRPTDYFHPSWTPQIFLQQLQYEHSPLFPGAKKSQLVHRLKQLAAQNPVVLYDNKVLWANDTQFSVFFNNLAASGRLSPSPVFSLHLVDAEGARQAPLSAEHKVPTMTLLQSAVVVHMTMPSQPTFSVHSALVAGLDAIMTDVAGAIAQTVSSSQFDPSKAVVCNPKLLSDTLRAPTLQGLALVPLLHSRLASTGTWVTLLFSLLHPLTGQRQSYVFSIQFIGQVIPGQSSSVRPVSGVGGAERCEICGARDCIQHELLVNLTNLCHASGVEQAVATAIRVHNHLTRVTLVLPRHLFVTHLNLIQQFPVWSSQLFATLKSEAPWVQPLVDGVGGNGGINWQQLFTEQIAAEARGNTVTASAASSGLFLTITVGENTLVLALIPSLL